MIRRLVPCLAALSLVVPLACVSEDPGLPPSPAMTCQDYCSTVQARCTGVNAQYRNNDECLEVCSLLDLGTRDDGDIATVGCRFNKAKTAADKASCAAAGPYGGGVCGARCVAYCTIADKECISDPAVSAALKPFPSSGDCSEACEGFVVSAEEDDGPPSTAAGGNTFQCRARHLIIAIGTPDPHCSHAAVDSPVCVGP